MTENAEKKEKKNDGWVIRVQFFPKDGKIEYFTFDMLYYQDRSWFVYLPVLRKGTLEKGL